MRSQEILFSVINIIRYSNRSLKIKLEMYFGDAILPSSYLQLVGLFIGNL